MVPNCVRDLNQSCINQLMKFVLYLKKILVTGKNDYKKMNCKLYGTEAVTKTKTSHDLEEGSCVTSSDGVTISVVQFPIPDTIMILIYERNKEYVNTY